VIVDEMHQAVHGGEVNVAITRGFLRESDIAGTLPDVINGTVPGRTSESEVTIFDSTGLAIQDIAVAILAYTRAVETGAGSHIEL
jgi:alanine dehydrogenase